MSAIEQAVSAAIPSAIRLDLGCGKTKKEGFLGVDRRAFPGVDVVQDLLVTPWKWMANSVDEVHMSHVLEHFTGPQRVQIMNELYRVMKPGAKAMLITPHWSSNRAYGDFTHQWPPVSEMFFYYLNREWRKKEAPDNDIEWNPEGYSCDFEATWAYGVRGDLLVRSLDYQVFALQNYKEAATDTIATLTAKK